MKKKPDHERRFEQYKKSRRIDWFKTTLKQFENRRNQIIDGVEHAQDLLNYITASKMAIMATLLKDVNSFDEMDYEVLEIYGGNNN